MNVREEDRQKNSCPSRGLGLAAAAIGVGVGAALYYFFSKRPENPDGEGSTTSGWTCEQPHTLSDHLHESGSSRRHTNMSMMSDDEQDSYLTISEHSTSDTSMYETDNTEGSEDETEGSCDEEESGEEDEESDQESEYTDMSDSSETGYITLPTISASNIESDSDATDWDVTNSSYGVPEDASFVRSPLRTLFENLGNMVSPRTPVRRRTTEEQQMNILRDQAFRERSWSLEECSICFDIILKDQQVTTLPCTHHFHSACIAPWLQEQQTCPNCRKAAE